MKVKDLMGILENCNKDAVVGLEISNQAEMVKFLGYNLEVIRDKGNVLICLCENGTKPFSKRLCGKKRTSQGGKIIMRTLSNEVVSMINEEAKNHMTVKDLQKLLSVKEDIAMHIFGEASMGHTYSRMASKMLKEILYYLNNFELDAVTFEETSIELHKEYGIDDEDLEEEITDAKSILTTSEKKKFEFRNFVYGQLKGIGKTQTQVADEMGLKVNTFNYKLKTLTFDVGELMELFKALEVEPERIGELLCIQ